MTATLSSPTESVAGKEATTRLASIDIFRGLTMTLMILVNALAEIKGLPWWTYHMKPDIDAMTYVDMVFPFFLFIVGLSMPLAIRHRLKTNSSLPELWLHVAVRTVSLVVLGLILANAEIGDPTRMGISGSAWAILALTGAALFLNVYPKSDRYSTLFRWLRMFGVLMVALMFAIFRTGTPSGQSGWINFHYPEILGYIGSTYLAVSILYIPTRRWLWAPLACFVAMISLNSLTVARWVTFTRGLRYYIWPFGNGSLCAITLAGILTSVIFLGAHRWQTLHQKVLLGLGFGISALVAGWLLTPLGISKVRATPTWSLYSIGAAVLVFTTLYLICDVRKKTSWAFFARPAGANTLTTYLLPDFWHYIIATAGIGYFDTHLNAYGPGVAWCVVFTAFMLAVSALLTRWMSSII